MLRRLLNRSFLDWCRSSYYFCSVHGLDSPLRSEITLETEIASNDVNGKTNVQSKDISEDNVTLWPSANGPMTRTGV